MGEVNVCADFVSPPVDRRIFVYDVLVGLPAAFFLLFLLWNVRQSIQKLRQSGSQIMSTYFAFLCGVTVINLLRCLVQIAQTENSGETNVWNLLWLLTRFVSNTLEISVVVFLLQGYASSNRQALFRTLAISGFLAGLESIIKVCGVGACSVVKHSV